MTEADCRAYFGYWLGLLDHPDRGALRRYLHGFGYDRLSARVKTHEHEYLLVYGTLGSEGRALDDLDIRPILTPADRDPSHVSVGRRLSGFTGT